MVQGKQKFALWLTPDGMQQVQAHYRKDCCKSQSEFIERAVYFYCGYLDTDKKGVYLPQALGTVLEGVLLQFGDRLGRLLFKQSVEISMMGRIIAADTELDGGTVTQLRDRCVKDVQQTNGQLSFRDMLRIIPLE